jgi:hypothetical protein
MTLWPRGGVEEVDLTPARERGIITYQGDGMKMFGVIDGVFWGVLLIAVGVWLLVRRSVPVHVPVIRVVIAVIFVYIGVRFLVRGPEIRDRNTAVFTESTMRYAPDKGRDYNLIFGSGTIDLSEASVTDAVIRAEVNVVFGTGTLRINPSQPVHVVISSAFGSVDAPNGRSVAFGESTYDTASYTPGSPALEIRATAVFGRLSIQP